jgi:ketosteroid isomerase-like protein
MLAREVAGAATLSRAERRAYSRRMNMQNLALLVASLALGACQTTIDERADALLAADRAFCAATQERRIEGWVDAFDENGSQFDDDFRPLTGKTAIRARMAPFFADPANELVWEPDSAIVSEGGNLGSTSGRFTMTRRREDGSRETLLTGRYFDVWRRTADGKWRLVLDLGEADARWRESEKA